LPQTPPNYIGRFAPSPTGPLHFGSLVAALASYLDAKANQGAWLVRIEDIDANRCKPEHASSILSMLEHYGLEWDGEVVYQTQRLPLYQQYLDALILQKEVYWCECSRKKLRNYLGPYPSFCRDKNLAPSASRAIRIKMPVCPTHFIDKCLGPVNLPSDEVVEDYIIRRRDGFFAYQLVVVIDDIEQSISHVVRGQDLISFTPRQRQLFEQFGKSAPQYGHIPLVLDEYGNKLSKQTFAPAITDDDKRQQLAQALTFLGLQPPKEIARSDCEQQLSWGIELWPKEHHLNEHFRKNATAVRTNNL
jgi:glutamyl-Q tRNA(Asp) synthetase